MLRAHEDDVSDLVNENVERSPFSKVYRRSSSTYFRRVVPNEREPRPTPTIRLRGFDERRVVDVDRDLDSSHAENGVELHTKVREATAQDAERDEYCNDSS